MEKLASDLKMSEVKQSSLGKACESLHAEASSVLHFTLQWKELEDHFDSIRNSLQTRFRELENREKRIDGGEKQLEALLSEFESVMASKSAEMRGVEELVNEKRTELDSGNHQYHPLNLLIEEPNEELDVKEKRFLELQSLIKEKESECDLIDKRIKERTKKLNWVLRNIEMRSKEVEPKEKDVEVVKGMLNKYKEDIELQEGELNRTIGLIEERKNVYDLREEKIIDEAERVVEECENKMKWKNEELRLIQKSINELDGEMNLKEEKFSVKMTGFYMLKKSMEEWWSKLEVKERELGRWIDKLELREKEFEPKLEELHLMDKRVNECLSEVQLKEKHFDSLQKIIQEHEKYLDSLSQGLQLKERQLEQQAKELEMKQKEFDLIRKCTEKHTKRNGRDLQLFLNEHLKKHDLVGTEISVILQTSPDPAKLVLDAMQGFHPSDSLVENRACYFELSVIRRSCILLLQELKKASPQINPLVREEAKKLAGDWKDKMTVTVENWLEVLGFWLLLTTYDLASTYDENELQSLLDIVSQHVQTAELSQALSISEKAHGSGIISCPVKIEEPESSLTKNGVKFSSPNLQPSSKGDTTNLQGFLKEHMNGNHSIQKEMLAALQISSDPAKIVLDEMQTSFTHYWKKEDVDFNETFILANIALLEELMRVSPHVGPHVKADAIKLADQWKAKMRDDVANSLESLGFLQFVAAYGFLSTLQGDEIKKVIGKIFQHTQVLELCPTLGFADKMPELIQNLIGRKQLFEAVRFICIFKMIDKFPPVPLLKEYVEGARKSYRSTWWKMKSFDEKHEVVGRQIADLRAVIQCIKDHKLESEYPSKDIDVEIAELEKLKENWRKSERSLESKAEQEEKKRSPSSSGSSRFEQRAHPKNKRYRTSESAACAGATPDVLPSLPPCYPSPHSSHYGVFGRHRSVGLAAMPSAYGIYRLHTSFGLASMQNPGLRHQPYPLPSRPTYRYY